MEETKVIHKMNLQLFADGDSAGADPSGANPSPEGSKTYTEEEMSAKLKAFEDQSKADLESAKKAWQAEFEEKLKSEQAEAEKLAKLSEDERRKAKFEKDLADFEKRQADFAKKELEYEVSKQLIDEKLDPKFASFLVGRDAQSSKENISIFKEAFHLAVEAAVTERLKGSAPPASVKKTEALEMEAQINGILGIE